MTGLTLTGIGPTVDDSTGVLTAVMQNALIAAGSTLTVTAQTHSGKTIALDTAAGSVCTLSASTGGGAKYRFVVTVVPTSNSHKVQVANSTDVLRGGMLNCDTDTSNATIVFPTASTSDTCTFNGTTQGGFSIGDWIEVEDIKAGFYAVRGVTQANGTVATPFSAAV